MRLRIERDEVNRHKVNVYVEAPYKFKNCLPKPLLFQVLSQTKKTTTTKEISTDQIFEEFGHSAEKRIYLKINLPGFFWSNEVEISSETDLQHIVIQDHNANLSGIQVKKYQLENGTIQYFFYCTAYLVNESPYDLLIHTSKEKEKPIVIGGQHEIMPDDDEYESNLVIFGEKQGEQLVLADKKTPKHFSDNVSITTPGNSEIKAYITIGKQERMISMGVEVQLKVSNQEPLLMTRQINIAPRYILVNNSKNIILARQEGEQGNRYAVLGVGDRQPVFWSDPKNPKEVNFLVYDKKQELGLVDPVDSKWDWSNRVSVNNVGVQNFAIRAKRSHEDDDDDEDDKNKINDGDILFMRTDTREGGSAIFIVIEDVTPDQIPYRIENKSTLVDLELKNPGYNGKVIKPNESLSFSWFSPSEKREMDFNVQPYDGMYQPFDIEFSPEDRKSVV